MTSDSKQLIGIYCFTGIFVAVGLLSIIYAGKKHMTEAALAAHGIHVTGQVRDAQVHYSSGNTSSGNTSSESWTLDIQYPTGKSSEYRSFDATGEAFRTHPFGSQVEVIYSQDDPGLAMLGGDLNANTSSIWFLGGLVFMIGGSAIAVYATIYVRGSQSDEDPDPPTELESIRTPPAPHWTNDPLSEDEPGNIPTK